MARQKIVDVTAPVQNTTANFARLRANAQMGQMAPLVFTEFLLDPQAHAVARALWGGLALTVKFPPSTTRITGLMLRKAMGRKACAFLAVSI